MALTFAPQFGQRAVILGDGAAGYDDTGEGGVTITGGGADGGTEGR